VPTKYLAKRPAALEACGHVSAPQDSPEEPAPAKAGDGKEHRYWSIVENRRVSGGRTVQRHVLYLGEINDAQRAAWCRTIEAFDENGQQARQIALFPEDRHAPALNCDVVHVRLSGLRLHRPRQWGACWLACHEWDQLRLDDFWSPRLPVSREGTRWLDVLKTLVAYRLIDPGSEWRLHRQWYEQSAMGDLLGADFALAHKDTLYRCLDKLLVHKADPFSFLQQRWKSLFGAEFEVLLYDLTSTYFECDPPEAGKRRFGYSRDKRSDCVQVVIALVVTPDGLPLAYEVMAGNTSDKTTLRDFIKRIETQYGRARRTWVMDRGIPTEKVLAEMRGAEPPIQYLVGTPRGRLAQLEQDFLTKPWTDVRNTVQVKLVQQDSELYVLARSGARRDKEQAMRRRRLKKLIKRLHELRQQKLTRDQLLIKLGAARKEAGPAAWRIIDIQLPDKDQPVTPETFGFKLNWRKLREARRRERRALARLNEWVRTSDLSALMTVKYLAGERNHAWSYLQYMTDSVVIMEDMVAATTRSRTLRIAKYRGSGFSSSPAPVVINRSGIEGVVLRNPRASYPTFTDRISSGVPRLDALLGGGYGRSHTVLLSGAPGTAKTSLCAYFVAAACKKARRRCSSASTKAPRK
jgi:KaiC/GvpD/RAD55 family RecA-like ATPase